MPADILRRKMPDIHDMKEARRILKDLKDTMFDSGAVGFAANQINEPYNICIAKNGKFAYEFVNPKIVRRKGVMLSGEGCYSLPGYYASIPRSRTISVTHLTATGKKTFTVVTEDVSRFTQHEIDHLLGILIQDYVDGTNGKSGGILHHKHLTGSHVELYLNRRKELVK